MGKKKILGILALFTTFTLTLASCELNSLMDNKNESNDSTDVTGTTTVTEYKESIENETTEAPEVTNDDSSLNVTVEDNAEVGSGECEESNNIYKITKAGEYSFEGEMKEGTIVVDTEGEVIINLNGVNISSTTTAPINIINADSVEIKAKAGTVNYITDSREETSSYLTAAIYSNSDLKIKGKGELYVYGNYNNGIHSKDDLTIKNLTLYVKALNNAIKGNDSVEIENANLTIISTGGDGIKSTNSDVSSKGNQKGTISILGSTIMSVYACCDGIDAAYNVDIKADDEGNEPEINIYTNAYSSYSDDTPTTISSSSTLYLQVSSSYYSSSYDYYAYCYDTSNNTNGEFIKFDYYTTAQSGMGFGGRTSTMYYYLKANVDTNKYSGIQIYMISSGSTPTTSSYYAASTGQTINETKDMITVKSVTSSTKKIGIDWSNYSSSSSQPNMQGGFGFNDGNGDKTSYSTKGIKANNEINIEAGNILIKSYDDSLHATANVTLENGSTSTGNINIKGGSLTLLSKDDAIHADSTLTIEGGSITVSSAYEGFEAKKVSISGGNHSIYATDDGINSSKEIIVSGGVISVSVASGDTDAIDSNGTYTQTGGVVISMNLSSSGTATVLDCDSTAKITGGVFLGFGKLETKPTVSNVKSSTKSASLSKGTYTLTYNDTDLATFTLSTSYSSFTLIGQSGSYKVGSTSISL